MPRMKTIDKPFAYSGFILTLEPERTRWIAERLYRMEEIKEPFSAVDWKFQRRELVALVLSNDPLSVFAFALMERMHGSGGSGKLKMRIYNGSLGFAVDDPKCSSCRGARFMRS